ncbi:MAG TPA: phosphoglycerate kinase [Candidatus Taylorbacteria bacterium]|nr:MAG: Phosphoglycerate kinase [Parcubacteria group bacterium GW2011_GWA2_47_64]KKU95457.1 MAG: Phosphoglycerate kinase [Parcubacteria group bacterium GW2011_GWC2_48_17]HBV01670.1 phosphoglycerate kinase [Candidatus Taylorbacteria bacterium]
MSLPLLKNTGDLKGKRVLLRLDLDVPVLKGAVQNAFRIESARETLTFLREGGARTLIIGHIGRDQKETLRPVFEYLKQSLPVAFAETLEDARKKMAGLSAGEFLLLQNLRSFPGETKNDVAFTKELASLADIFVNEAFAVSHREHASIVGVPALLQSFAGFVFAKEVEYLSKVFTPAHPALLILGGAKFETKIPLIERFLNIADDIYICGALANDIYRARGYETGVSLVSDCKISQALLESPKMHIPSDVIIRADSGNEEKGADNVGKTEKIVDAGSDALADLRALVEKAAFVLWNGPLGLYEEGFDQGTIALAQALVECDAETVIGGGDSIAVVSKLGLLERFSFVSTGGGAMLEFLAKQTLPGIEALRNSASRK